MQKYFTLFLLFLSIGLNAQLSTIKLTENQFKKIENLDIEANKDSMQQVYLAFKNADTSFSALNDTDFLKIATIINPRNTNAYSVIKKAYDIAFKVSDNLVKDVSNEENSIRIAVYRGKKEFLKQNLTRYIQNQFFDFYFNNNVMSFLDNSDYIALFNPQAVYKLLLYAKPEANLKEEIDFIALNSNFKF
jgi:hypothetical protein